jgi:CBS-domain-containing membrane protein
MAAEGVHHLPVIGDHGRVVGLVSTLDVTRWLARQSGYDV